MKKYKEKDTGHPLFLTLNILIEMFLIFFFGMCVALASNPNNTFRYLNGNNERVINDGLARLIFLSLAIAGTGYSGYCLHKDLWDYFKS
jgi:hypothetical protein